MILTGALVNGGAIVVGGLLGTFGGKLMPEKMRQRRLRKLFLCICLKDRDGYNRLHENF